MSEPRDMNNEELSALLAEYAAIGYTLPGNSEMAPNLAEAARRLAALPRIYDVQKGERPEGACKVLAIHAASGRVESYEYQPSSDKLVERSWRGYGENATCEVYRCNPVLYTFIIKCFDIATWVKGEKG